MATTFGNTFKNRTIDSFTGRASTTSILTYFGFFNGAQPASPADTPVGSSVYSSYSLGPNISTFMTQPASGVSSLNIARSTNATNTVGSITFGRLYDASGTAHIDMDASLAGGGGGVITASLSSSASSAYTVSAFSLKLPLSLNTVMLNDDLANALIHAWTITAANVAAGSSAAIKVYSGSAPATANAPATGTLLVTFNTGASGASWNTASAGSAALVTNLTASASATGTAGYVRIEKGTYVLQGSVGTSGADFLLDTTNITSGNTITLTEATLVL